MRESPKNSKSQLKMMSQAKEAFVKIKEKDLLFFSYFVNIKTISTNKKSLSE